MGLTLTERKIINNGAADEKLPEYAEGKWLHRASLQSVDSMIPGGINFLGSAVNSFGEIKSPSNILTESGTSVGQGSGFTYLKLNPVDAGAQMSELSKLNTANTLLTAAAGASLGSAFGPIGAGIGGVVGGAVGVIGGLFRKNKMADRIREALLLAVRNNNFSLASALTDYLTNQYNAEHNNTYDNLLYSAKEGLEPSIIDNTMQMSGFVKKNGRYVFDGRIKVSRGEIYGHVNDQGEVTDAHIAGIGVDNKDSLIRRAGYTPDQVERTFVLSNKEENGLNGIAPSAYAKMTGDYDGAIAMQNYSKEMKSHIQDVREIRKAIGNGALNLPTDILTAKCGKIPKYAGGKGMIKIAPPPVLTTEQMDALKVPERQTSQTESVKNSLGVSPKDLEANNYMTESYRNLIGGGPVYTDELERTFEQNPKMKNTSTWSDPNDWVIRNGNLVKRLQAALDDANKNVYNSNLVNAIANGLSMFGGLALIIKSHEPAAELKSVYYNPYERQAVDLALNRRSNLNLLFSDSARAEAMNRYNILNRLGGLGGALKMLMMQNSGIANQYTNAKLRAADNEYKNNRDFQNAQFIAGLGDTKGKYGWLSSETFYDRLNKAMGMKWANWQEGMYNMINPFLAFAKGYNNNARFKAILPFYTTDYKAFG